MMYDFSTRDAATLLAAYHTLKDLIGNVMPEDTHYLIYSAISILQKLIFEDESSVWDEEKVINY